MSEFYNCRNMTCGAEDCIICHPETAYDITCISCGKIIPKYNAIYEFCEHCYYIWKDNNEHQNIEEMIDN